MGYCMGATRKITINLPGDLVDGAVHASGRGVTETIRQALREYNHRWACREFLALKGKVKFASSWQELRGKDEER